MDALEFLKERKRMCNCYEHCEGCPLERINCALNAVDSDEENEQVIAAVEQWSKEHPRKTRQSIFLEQYPEARLAKNGILLICPCAISAEYRSEGNPCSRKEYSTCADCRREFWMQEMERLGVDPCKPPHKPIN